jgi:hypothetical protein
MHKTNNRGPNTDPCGIPDVRYDYAIVKVETGIVTLISYRHYLKIAGNNKL